MASSTHPQFPLGVPPDPDSFSFDLDGALSSLLSLQAHVPDDALTAPVLGTERQGHAAVIGARGLSVTVGYLVTEAERIWITDTDRNTVGAHVLANDQETGLSLIQPLADLDVPAAEVGTALDLGVSDIVVAEAYGGVENALVTEVTAKCELAGYWEYVLDEAIFTSPAHASWGGAALFGRDGKLCGVGSLLVQQQSLEGKSKDANMFIPIEGLHAAMDELLTCGRRDRPPRPWIGCFVYEVDKQLIVTGLYASGPAEQAGLKEGDIITEVQGWPVTGLADLFRAMWALGEAGVEIPLSVLRNGARMDIVVDSASREGCLKSPMLH